MPACISRTLSFTNGKGPWVKCLNVWGLGTVIYGEEDDDDDED